MIEFVAEIVRRRAELQSAAKRGYAAAVAALPRRREAVDPEIAIPPGMVDSLVAAGLAGPELGPALEALFALVAKAGLQCAALLGAGTPDQLVEGRAAPALRRLPSGALVEAHRPAPRSVAGGGLPAALRPSAARRTPFHAGLVGCRPRRAEQALRVHTVRRGLTFHAERAEPPGPLRLDEERCEISAPWPGPDAVGAPPVFPYPPALCARGGR